MEEKTEPQQSGGIFEQSMKDALAHLDSLNAELMREREKAIDLTLEASEELERIHREAELILRKEIEAEQHKYEKEIRRKTMAEVTEKLMQAGRSSREIKTWLNVDAEMIANAWFNLGFEVLGDMVANVTYESQGRGGYVYFNGDGILLKFYYEFSGGNSLATIDVPPAEKWEEQTGIKLDLRRKILEFIGNRVIRDQAPGHQFEIANDYIHIYK